MSRLVSRVAVAVCAALALTTGCSPDDPVAAPDREVAVLTRVAQFANTLTGFTTSPGDRELLVADRLGAIWRLDQGRSSTDPPELAPDPVLDLTGKVSSSPGERGFFGLLLSPDGRSLIVDYTARSGSVTVEQYPYEPGKSIDPTSGRTLFTLTEPSSWHHGGGLAFTREGDLLVGIGDLEFRQIDPPGPQDPALMIGGILRIPAAVVENPDVSSLPTPRDMIARGLRNPWRISIDDRTGDLWVGDVGLDTYEELDRIPAEDLDGTTVTNFGWPYREGPDAQQGTPPQDVELVDPVHARRHGPGVCGIVGGFTYTGTAVPALAGRYIYGDLCGDQLRALHVADDGKVSGDRAVAEVTEPIVSLGQRRDGELFALGSAGGLYRIDRPGSGVRPSSQAPSSQATTTTIERSRTDCAGVVAIMLPLADIGSMDGAELIAALDKANRQLAEVVPTVPDHIRDDALTVQRAMRELTDQLVASKDDLQAAAGPLRAELLAGRGVFTGFPDAMARIVDSECG